MSIESKLDQALVSSPVIEIDDSFKGLFISDLHMGIGDEADDFKGNASLCLDVLRNYRDDYRIFVLGDAYELWENSNIEDIKKTYPELCDFLLLFADTIVGNHDQGLILPQSYVLFNKKAGKKILLVHGHQGDFFCDEGYPFAKFVSRYVWRNLQMVGFRDPTTAQKDKNPQKHELTRIAFHDWAWSRKQTVIFGHIHLAETDPPYYWNCGSWVGDGGQAVVITGNQISLKTFSIKKGVALF
jgi:UDP-2,3-diacylglucosamine pyrophosphatase LpxH